jgi:hypothetical protein
VIAQLRDARPFLLVTLPFRLSSRGNARGHSLAHAKGIAAQREGTTLKLAVHRARLIDHLDKSAVLAVRAVRVSPQELDVHDNLGMSLKAVIDGIADALKVTDADPRIEFIPDAQRGAPGVVVEFYPLPPGAL